MKQKKFNTIEFYFSGFSAYLVHLNYLNTVVKGQNLIRTWITRKRFLKLKKCTIIIQRAWRTYYFKKKGAKALFSQTYKFYEDKVGKQNKIISQYLYNEDGVEEKETIDLLARNYLGKFK